jgi:hypothetical protein
MAPASRSFGPTLRDAVAALVLVGCTSIPIEEIGSGDLRGRVYVEWYREDRFVYRRTADPVTFKPSFMTAAIVPDDMYTDGGSVPRIFWSIPGLSPWGLGPAYIIHDWLFEVHRCGRDAPEEVSNITFEQSARILAEVGKSLVDAGLIDNNRLPEVVWAVRTRYARSAWDRPVAPGECERPDPPLTSAAAKARTGVRTVVDFTIPPPAR